ncbi:MAG: aldo/keto reductase [Dehalococcoidia bacterium]|nr:aldo/keto reductase [Dehalococcoidia bacterium]
MELRGSNASIRNGKSFTDEEAKKVLNTVLDVGINFIDTSIDYGMSEEMIGKHIAHRRSEYFLASKCGCAATPEALLVSGQHINKRENIVAGVNQSLKRMKTDYLDLVQFHRTPSPQDMPDAVQTLHDLHREGKVRFIGSSSTLPELPDLIKSGSFDAFQIPYSALEREHETVIAQAAKAGAGTVIRGGVARGERGRGNADPNRWMAWDKARMNEILDGMSQFEFLLRFTISHPDVHTTIVGTINPDHILSNVAALRKGPLPPNLYAEAKKHLAAAGAVPA